MSECCIEVLEVSPTAVLVIEQDATPEVIEIYQGLTGATGAPGTGYIHTQASASLQWVINHNLGLRPVVAVVDPGGYEVDAEIIHMSTNQTVINFTTPLAGFARLS